ncbi:hypothetical protein C1Y63_04670 [Corynebacterium sp. 13CS0277]|uniref:hypothetical protein n=1 Tax=Corynebacterium sp. 13CS0277 TaxID=2071994 RepID=UPI000D0434EC|nr:hypothetical protein [Corynebacterium sp. 13CS0277]PRQ11705.1 hypothetical protein C1Y63_04670 [Corynebacterium sp. 13CS0277]
MRGPYSWAQGADRARVLGSIVLAAFCTARLIVWMTPWPNVVPPLDIVEAALPPLLWMVLWGTAAVGCAIGATNLRVYRWSTGFAGTLLFVWGVSYAIAAFNAPGLVMPACMNLALAGMVLVNGSFSSLLPSRLEPGGAHG